MSTDNDRIDDECVLIVAPTRRDGEITQALLAQAGVRSLVCSGLKELAEQTGKNVAKLRVEYRDQKKREMLIGMILENKVLDIIEAKAKITEA